jgi:hypothetical protein
MFIRGNGTMGRRGSSNDTQPLVRRTTTTTTTTVTTRTTRTTAGPLDDPRAPPYWRAMPARYTHAPSGASAGSGAGPQRGAPPSGFGRGAYAPRGSFGGTSAGASAALGYGPAYSGAASGVDLLLHPAPVSLRQLKRNARLGSEFTFTGRNFDNSNHPGFSLVERWNPATLNALDALVRRIASRFRDVVIDRDEDPQVIDVDLQLQGGCTITLGLDPDVIETQITPMTYEQYGSYRRLINEVLFDTAGSLGIRPDDGEASAANMQFGYHAGAGHIHFDLETTFRDARHLLNVYIDMQNHPELAVGGMTNEPLNAPPLAIQPARTRRALQRLIADVEPRLDEMSKEELADLITTRVHTEQLEYGTPEKYQQIALHYAGTETEPGRRTVEVRALRPQSDVDDFMAVADLLLERIALCSRVRGILPYTATQQIFRDDDPSNTDFRALRSDFPAARAQQNLDGMATYFREMGRDFGQSLRFIEPALRERLRRGWVHPPEPPRGPPSMIERVQQMSTPAGPRS